MKQISKIEDTAKKALDTSLQNANDIKTNGWTTGLNAGGNINNTESRNQGGTGDNETASPNEGNNHLNWKTSEIVQWGLH